MAAKAKAHWKQRCYTGGRRWLRRGRLEPWLDYYACELILSEQPARPLSSWDQEALWLGEVRSPQLAWLTAFAPERAKEFPARWAQGLRCFAAALDPLREPRCVGYVWVATGARQLLAETGVVWDIPLRGAWIFDALSHPLVLGTYPDLVRFAVASLRAQGYTAMLGQVEYDNRVSRRVHRVLGRRLGWLLTLRLGKLTMHLERRTESGAGTGWNWCAGWGRTPVRLAGFMPAPAPLAAPAQVTAARPLGNYPPRTSAPTGRMSGMMV